MNSTNQSLTDEFVMYRPGSPGLDVRYRDLEFGWDTLFAAKLSDPVRQTLYKWAGMLLLDTGVSPLAPEGRGLEVVYNYLRLQGGDWSDQLSQRPLWLGTNANSYSAEDRGHVDLYLTVPNRIYETSEGPRNYGGQYPSGWNAYGEDLTSGWPADTALDRNSFSLDGPPIGQEIDTLGTGWAKARTSYQTYFHHEFQHTLPPFQPPANGTEFWSAAAEVVGGHYDFNSTSEFPYNFPMPNEYQARTSFLAYVGYNFLNADTNRTLSGMQDDLLYKWAKARSTLGGLQQLGTFLTDAQCATCASKQYFRPGGVPLSGHDRVGVLMHHWRMAMFADHPTLAEGQFGFPAWSGFKPSSNVRAWSSFAGTLQDDVEALPQVVTLTQAEIVTPREFRHTRSLHGGTAALALSQAGANYWVIRADSALRTQNRRLVARVTPLAALRLLNASGGGGRLHASFLTYSHTDSTAAEESILWRHPEWLSGATPIQTVDLDSTSSEIELSVPDFGQTSKVVVLVLTIADGRFQGWGNDLNSLTRDALPYRLGLELRESAEPFVATSLFANEDSTRAAPAWARDDTTLVFSATESSGLVRLWRKSITGGAAQALNQQPMSQFYPDCAPFSDVVVYEGVPDPQQASETSLYLTSLTPNTNTSATKLTNLSGCEAFPAFQPDGKGVVYLHNGTPGNWDLRWVAVDGTGDKLLASLGPLTSGACRPRWSADGNKIYVVKANAGNRIHSVAKSGSTPALVDDHPLPVMSFDIHTGLGPNALATTTPTPATTPSGAPSLEAPRIALYTAPAATRDTVFRFNRTARLMDAPRISPRGTRLVAQSRRAGGPTSIHWGRIEDNLPPSIGALSTLSGFACLPLQVGLPASDPEGEPLSWSMVYPPPGAQIVQGNVFRWQHPVVGEYETVFRARDPRGGLDSRLILISITEGDYCEDPLSGGAGGGGGFRSVGATIMTSGPRVAGMPPTVLKNSFLDGVADGEWVTQDASLPPLPISSAGQYDITLSSGSPTGADVDRVQLVVVDHTEGTVATAGPTGLMFGRPSAAVTLTLISEEASSGLGEAPLQLVPGTIVEATFPTSHEARGIMVSCQQAESSPGAGIEVLTPSGQSWNVVGRLRPRRAMDRLSLQGVVSERVRLRFTAPTILSAVERVLWSPSDQAAFVTHETDVASLDGGESTMDLRVADQVSLHIEPGAPRVLRFGAPAVADGATRDLFLRVTGRISLAASSLRTGEGALASQPIRAEFGLGRIEPNPSVGRASLPFSIASSGHVEFDVYDIKGARVRSLVRGPLEAGPHQMMWDGRDERGAKVAAGTYFVRLSSRGSTETRRFVLLQ